MNGYTYILPWQRYLLRQLGLEFPYVEMMYVVFREDLNRPLKALLSKRKNKKHIIEEFDISGSEGLLEHQRSNNNGFHKWYSPNGLTVFPSKRYDIHTVGIFKEEENTVLMISFTSEIDQKSDLLYIFIDKNKLDFGMQSKKEALSIFEKQFIQTSIYHRLNVLLEDQRANIKAYARDRKSQQLILSKYAESKRIIQNQQHVLDSVLNYIIEQIVFKEQKVYGAKIIIPQETRSQIGFFVNHLEQLEQRLLEAIARASLNYFEEEDIVVEEWYFETEIEQVQTNKLEHTERENIIIKIMEDIEQSIVQTRSNNEKTIASNIVKYLNNKMTPQAITDYFKRYKKEIGHLYEQDSPRWKLLYDNFRPFNNAVD